MCKNKSKTNFRNEWKSRLQYVKLDAHCNATL